MPGGSKPAGQNGYGLLDLAGNIAEWVADRYAADACAGPAWNPVGPATGSERGTRGAAFGNSGAGGEFRVSARGHEVAELTIDFLGFRCARSTW